MENSSRKVPKALVYSTSQSALVVLGSTGSCSCSDVEKGTQACYLNSDEDAKKMYETFVRNETFMKPAQAKLILSSSNECNREKVLEAIKQQASSISGEDSMFVFVYTGGVCDRSLHEIPNILNDDAVENYSLVLHNYDFKSTENALFGSMIGTVLQESNPEQVFLVLECPHAEKIAKSIKESLSNCSCIEVAVPMGLKRAPCYIRSLHCSAFVFFLSLIMNRTDYASGMFPLRMILDQVEKCCEALSCLDMVQDGDWIRKNATIPKSQFMEIPVNVERNLNMETEGITEGEDSVDGDFRFQSIIEKFYSWKKSFMWIFKKDSVKPCNEAVDWARAITRVYLTVLEEAKVLQGEVLEAAVGSIVSSITTIQIKKEGSISSSNFFIQAFMLAIASVDFVSQNNPELQNDSMLTSAAEYYLSACTGCPPQATEPIKKLVEANNS